MKVYEVSEFIFLLRCGLWCGGKVAEVGYVSATRAVENPNLPAGLTGHHLGNRIMLERSGPGSCGQMQMSFSVYDPYTGDYRFFEATAHCREDMVETLLTTLRTLFGPRRHKSKITQTKHQYKTRHIIVGSGVESVTRQIR